MTPTTYAKAAATTLIVAAVFSCAPAGSAPHIVAPESGETHLTNIHQLTFGGENAEAYFSADGKRLIFQAKKSGDDTCDQEYVMDADGSHVVRVSTGFG